MASIENPNYTVYVVAGKHKYNFTPAVVDIDFSDQEKQLAQSVSVTMVNRRTTGGKSICDLLDVRHRIFIYADDGTKKDEVFRGWIWTAYHKTDVDSALLTYKCYDNLIYLQESEDAFWFSKGKRTKTILNTICKKWGIPLNYSYSSITHKKMALKGSLSNILTADLLDKVKKRTGKKYVITSKKDIVYIKPEGTNTKVYQILKKNNVTDVKWEKTMDGMITKVKIVGKKKKKSKEESVLITVTGDTSKYGTLQKVQSKGSDEKLADAKKEAKTTIKEHGKPTEQYNITGPDIPWIRKGDKIYVNAGHITGKMLIVKGIDRSISNKAKTMTLTMEKP